MSTAQIDLDGLADIIRRHPEVAAIYPPRLSVAQLAARAVNPPTGDPSTPSITAEEQDGVLHVTVTIAVSNGFAAPTVGLIVGSSVANWLPALSTAQLEVTIRVATIG